MSIHVKNKRILITKTNQIGDVTFALPIASILKQLDSSCTVVFLARSYTRDLVELYQDVDEFVDWEALKQLTQQQIVANLQKLNIDIIIHVIADKFLAKVAKKAKIPVRIGNSRRLYNWFYCNKLVRVKRKDSELHESQLDMQFLRPFHTNYNTYSLDDIIRIRKYKHNTARSKFIDMIDKDKFNLILHPLTRGRHIEWSQEHFASLIRALNHERVNIFVTGSEEEGILVRELLVEPFNYVTDLSGKMSLSELINFISNADGLIAASTGPVHLAANFSINTLGLYAPIRPFHAGRWGPIGKNVTILNIDKNCSECRFRRCVCINEITVQQVLNVVNGWLDLNCRQHNRNHGTAEASVT